MNPVQEFGLSAEATSEEVRALYKERSKELHPDVSPDEAKWLEFQALYKRALAFAGQPRKCPSCVGSGKTHIMIGFNATWHLCKPCGGSGKIIL